MKVFLDFPNYISISTFIHLGKALEATYLLYGKNKNAPKVVEALNVYTTE